MNICHVKFLLILHLQAAKKAIEAFHRKLTIYCYDLLDRFIARLPHTHIHTPVHLRENVLQPSGSKSNKSIETFTNLSNSQ